MHIQELKLVNFRRFDELTIDLGGLPTPPKLVLLVGANGSGKTGIFDAFEWVSRFFLTPQLQREELVLFPYYKKAQKMPTEVFAQFVDGTTFHRRDTYQETVYYIDELDVHLNTALQYTFLKEITENWIPDGCQLWTASHSLGFIQYAQESVDAAIIDFDQHDFDRPWTITPQPKEALEVYEIAVPKEMLAVIFKDKQIVFCENKDDELYNLLGLDGKLFLPAQNKNAVYFAVKNNPGNFGLMDRDYLTDAELANIKQALPHLLVLGSYSIESYLYHPDNIAELVPDFDKDAYIAELRCQKDLVRDKILLGLHQTRRSYRILSTERTIEEKNAEEKVAAALASSNFDEYYPYLNMKDKVDRSYLASYNLARHRLARTAWFRSAIADIFESA